MNAIDGATFPSAQTMEKEGLRAAFIERYRESVPGMEPHGNETIELLLRHRSVRTFLPDPLPEGTLETLVAAAQSAPTSSFVQAWSVVAIEDQQRKSRFAELAENQKHIAEAPLLLAWVADLAHASDIAARRGMTLEGLDFTESFLLATVDAALAAQNAVVAAESLGLGTVYVGALRNHPLEIARELRLPSRCYAVFGLVVGRPDPSIATAVKPRLPQAAVLHREYYSALSQPEAVARHDQHTRAFRREQGLSAQGWSDLLMARLGTVASLKGRHVLRDALHRLGFLLK